MQLPLNTQAFELPKQVTLRRSPGLTLGSTHGRRRPNALKGSQFGVARDLNIFLNPSWQNQRVCV